MTNAGPVDQDRQARAWYDALPPMLQTLVDDCVHEMVTHPRMRGKMFAEKSALQLVYRLYVFTGERRVKWPQRPG